MTEKTITRLIKSAAALLLLVLGATIWYYTVGRKPKLVLSVPIADRTGGTSAHAVGPDGLLLVSGGNATLYDMALGTGKWTISLASTAPAAPAAAPAAKNAPAKFIKVSAPAKRTAAVADADDEENSGLRKLAVLPTGERPDLLLPKRVEKRRVKLVEWAARLNAKRASLKTPLQIESFNEEAKKYHAELADARREAASIPQPTATGRADEREEYRDFDRYDSFSNKAEVIADGNALVLLRDRRALVLDRATGKTTKEIALGGAVQQALRGVGCVFAISATPGGSRDVTRIALADGAVQTRKIEAPAGEQTIRRSGVGEGFEPEVQPSRADFSASGSALLQLEVRLVEKKI